MIQKTNFADIHGNIFLNEACCKAKIDWRLLSIIRILNESDFSNLTRVDKWHHQQRIKILNIVNSTTLNPLLARTLNLSNPNLLKQFLANQFQSTPYVESAVKIIKRLYETGSRAVADNGGFIFPMNPEILASSMRDAEGIALEIAGGAGENAILLAFSNFEKVYYNDLEKSETAIFKELTKQLPTAVSNKLKLIEGYWRILLKNNPEIAGNVSLVLCRNLIHFLSPDQKHEFLSLIHRILKVGGKAIFTANSIYGKGQEEYFKSNKNSVYFKCYQSAVFNLDNLDTPTTPLYDFWEVNSSKTNTIMDPEILFECNQQTGYKWILHPEALNQINEATYLNIRENLYKISPSLNIKNGIVGIHGGTTQLFGKKNFRSLFEKNDFNVESLFIFSEKGHLLNSNEHFKNGRQIGAIVTKR